MGLESQDIDNESLKQLSYAELRKLASKFGIQRMKAEKLVSAVMSKISGTDDNDTEDCFSTPAAKLMNSSKKNKEKIFDKNQKTPLATPRRGTFTVETPSFVKDATPFVDSEDSASVLDESNVTFSRGSERKLRTRKVSFMSPALTPRTPRSQSLRNRPKTPIATRTPLSDAGGDMNCDSVGLKRKSPNKSLLGSPETKVASLTGDSGMALSSSVQKSEKRTRQSRAKISPKTVEDDKTENVGKNISTPLHSSVQKSVKRTRQSRANMSPKKVEDDKTENVGKNFSTPLPSSVQKSAKRARLSRAKISPINIRDEKATSAVVNELTSLPADAQKLDRSMNISRSEISRNDKATTGQSAVKEPNSAVKGPSSAVKEPTSLKKKQTPNFKKIHQKAFDKMESIDDYQKRKLLNSAKKLAQHSMLKSRVTKAKSKIPAFSGIPFLSSLDSKSSAKSGKIVKGIMDIANGSKAPPKSKENVFKFGMQNRSVVNNKKENLPKTPLLAKSKSKLGESMRRKDTPTVSAKKKFDLMQSLSRKLSYRPHRGPLKPLLPTAAANTSVHSTSILPNKEPVQSQKNQVVTQNRSQTRSLIRGVRMNKRFELQMKNRKLD